VVKPDKLYVAWAETGAEPRFLGAVPEGTPAGDVEHDEPRWSSICVTPLDEYIRAKMRYMIEVHFSDSHR
jgi:hypothetical protein